MEQKRSKFTFPCVTVEQMVAFDSDRPDTWTPSPLVNAVLDAFAHVRPINCKALGQFLGLSQRDVSYGLHAVTGLTLQELMDEWRVRKFHSLLRDKPGISGKEMASRLAFSSQGALWKFLTAKMLIKPLTRQGWSWGDHYRLHKEAETAIKKNARADARAEMNRRKWEELTKGSNQAKTN